MPTLGKRAKDPALGCKCKEGRCVECRQCPRLSCKLNPCQCPEGPTRLPVPRKRKLGEIFCVEGVALPVAAAAAASASAANATPTQGEDGDLFDFGMSAPPPPPTEIALPVDLQNMVLRCKPLESAEDVIEALQLPRRQVLSRFQRRRIQTEGGVEASLVTNFDERSSKNTVQTFLDGVRRLAEIILPEAPDYLQAALPLSPSFVNRERQLLEQVMDTSPRKSIQARTARAVLAAASTNKNVGSDGMTKYTRKAALFDWQSIEQGHALVDEKRGRAQKLGGANAQLETGDAKVKNSQPSCRRGRISHCQQTNPSPSLGAQSMEKQVVAAMLRTMSKAKHHDTAQMRAPKTTTITATAGEESEVTPLPWLEPCFPKKNIHEQR